MNKVCLQCGKRFEKKWNYSRKYFSTQKYCSYRCMSEAYKRLGVGNHELGKWAKEHTGSLAGNWKGGYSKKKWRHEHPEKEHEYHVRYRLSHVDKVKSYQDNYKREHRARYTFLQNQRKMLIKKVGGSFTFEQWQELCDRCKNICKLCGKKEKMTIDHIIPITKGGDNNIENIQPLCLSCNVRKSNNI